MVPVSRYFKSDNMAENNTLNEWSDGEDDWIIEMIGEEANVDDSEWYDSEGDDIIRNMDVDDIQTGRGEKRKSDEPLLPQKDFYEIESVKNHYSKKFGMTATDHTIRFNTVLSEIDLIESYERTHAIFEHILDDVTRGMNEKDRVRFVLRSDQLDLPISIPFMPLAQLTTERVFSQIPACYTIQPGLQIKRYGNDRHNTRSRTSGRY